MDGGLGDSIDVWFELSKGRFSGEEGTTTGYRKAD